MSRPGIGVNQGRVLGLLVLMEPRPMAGDVLAAMAYPSGDRTQGRRVLASLMHRGLIIRSIGGPGRPPRGGSLWCVTPDGRRAFGSWIAVRVRELAGVQS